MQIKTRAIQLAAAGLLYALPVAAQTPVTVSLPEVTAAPGESVDVPIQVTDMAGLDVRSADLLIHYDARVAVASDIRQNRTLTHRWSQAHRIGFAEGSEDTIGLIDIALATGTRVPDAGGTFVILQFTVDEAAAHGDSTVLHVMEAVLNNQDPQTVTVNGKIRVRTSDRLPGDFNGDCVVNFKDFLLFMRHYGSQEGDPKYDPAFDLNGDGKINFGDFLIFMQYYGKTCDDL